MTTTSFVSTLGNLSDPLAFTAPLNIEGTNQDLLLSQLRMMLLIRAAEEKIADMVTAGKVGCPCHLAIGQEAVAVGVSSQLRRTDHIFGGHRSHAHYLAQGGSLHGLLAEILGKVTGCSKGMGGSMHLYDAAHGFRGSVPIVAGTISLAVGAGLAAKKDKMGAIAVTYFGDGAAEEGDFHEAMNLASVFQLPVLFVCENNLFSSHLHINLRQPSDSIARFAEAHRIAHKVVDGNDVVATAKAVETLLCSLRRGSGPAFLEAVTYRWRGHVGPREDQDVGVRRSTDLGLWKKRDPIGRLVQALMLTKHLDQETLDCLHAEIAREIECAWDQAEKDPFPELSATEKLVYADLSL